MADLDESNLRRYLDEAVSAAHEAGNLMLECFARNDAHTSVEEKASNADLVTKYDRQVEELVLTRLRACAPDFGVVAEETASKEELTDAPTWVVDPIDGTTNFIHRQAECCVLIGLAVRKRAVLGVCFIPKMDELYTAIKGHGAFCNGRRIASSKFWVNQPGQLSFEIQFNRGDRVRDLRTVIEKVTGIPPEAQELRANGEMVDKEGQFLEAMDLSDIWVMDDRDDSPERGEWNPDPEEDMSLVGSPLKIGTYIFSAILTIFWVTQVAGVNPYGNWPEGPRLDWSQVPEDLRPGNTPIQRPQALTVEPEQEKKMIEQRNKLPAA
ncbi:Inositol monophosphatase 2 (IMP 2) (IMPase 2) (LeIMP2) (Inositol-1(or 4)-monophosphatase 2) [Durusdinium trenchii]|uniref:Inositol monophosphatase 2 (IMP 2) (IMPase 2) (LeIMP2) (Inositol-1(Or 4)-monophosphatase 2) n=1 Tax=Durusdinium trenchii TaxID=1381693 RepID=A0ABP0NEI5_9DINO